MCSCLDCNNHYLSLSCPDVTQNNLRYRLYFSISTSRSELTDLEVIEIDSIFALTADDFFFVERGRVSNYLTLLTIYILIWEI